MKEDASLTYLSSAILGLVQGVAEFLPISSSGHLSLMQNLMDMTSAVQGDILFDVLLHLGTLVAVCVVYFHDIVDMIKDFFSILRNLFSRGQKKPQEPTASGRMVLMLIVATLPLVLVIPIQKYVKGLYDNTIFIGCALLATGVILFLSDRIQKGRKTAYTATIKDALIVGLSQAVAVVPGLSRSGTTISTGMLLGFDRKFAVRFSFLLSIPAILGANVFEIGSAVQGGIDVKLIPIYLLGMAIAAVSGFFAIKLVNLLAQKGKFGNFAYYCWAIGLIAIIGTLIKGL